MARSRSRSRPAVPPTPDVPPPPPPSLEAEIPGDTTGRFLVLMRQDAVKEGLSLLKSNVGLSEVCRTADFEASAVDMDQSANSEVTVFDQLAVAVVDVDPTQAGRLSILSDADSSILAVEPERILYALPDQVDVGAMDGAGSLGTGQLDYLRGYRDAVNALYAALAGGTPAGTDEAGIAAVFGDSHSLTWGLQATRVAASRFTGRGVRVAVLDTGFDLNHPDFQGRSVVSQSFVSGQTVQDGNGHGTHCIGTALGSDRPLSGVRRYGCAFRAEIFAGKVLSNQGSGADGGILAGINWAIANRCRIVSMSLGAPTSRGQTFSQVYEQLAQRALNANTLIIAAAGNDSRDPSTGLRSNPPNPVGHPANCPSILAVAALDERLRVASFSNGGINPNGGGVDVAGPGVNTFSSWPMPTRHRIISGTSMATPHVAGIAALWLEARGLNTSARGLAQLLVSNALRLNLSSRDVGAGLVQAP